VRRIADGRGSSIGDQCSEFLQTSMDVDFDERCGLARRIGGSFDADTLQLYEPDHAGLRGIQPLEQAVDGNSAYRNLAQIFGRYSVVERHRCEARGLSNLIDPLVACDRRDPRPKDFVGAYVCRLACMARSASCLASSAAGRGSRRS
jgi:hypothetical protein